MSQTQSQKRKKKRIAAFAFRAPIDSDALSSDEELSFMRVDEGETVRLTEFDGVILSQSTTWAEHGAESDRKRSRERRKKELMELLNSGGWICFLVWRTDLTDKGMEDFVCEFLKYWGVEFRAPSHRTVFQTNRGEFTDFKSRFANGCTQFFFPPNNDIEVIMTAPNDEVYGIAIESNFFVLPCHTIDLLRQDETQETVLLAAKAIVDYRANKQGELPGWIDEVTFAREAEIESRLSQIRSEAKVLEEELHTYREVRGIIALQGDRLRNVCIGILRHLFGLNVHDDDKCIEDFLLVDGSTKPIAVGEVKGISKGVTRNHVKQVDSHRDRQNLGLDVPGLLIINDEMALESIEQRRKRPIHPDAIEIAARLNVLVVRTCDLLPMLIDMENAEPSSRATILLGALKQDGGQFVYENNNVTVKRKK